MNARTERRSLQMRTRSTGQEWSPWEDVVGSPCETPMVSLLRDSDALYKCTYETNYGLKLQWRPKP